MIHSGCILNAVFGSILEFPHVQDVVTGISAFFSMEDFAETAFSLRQTDIDGFYNQVEHDRILLAIQFAVFTFASQCEQGLDTVMQSHVVRLERFGTDSSCFSRILERKDETIYDYYFA